jgi:hypothetical protein
MKFNFREFWQAFLSGPDPVLAEAGVAGELLVAKVRLSLATLLLLIPVINSIFFCARPKGRLGRHQSCYRDVRSFSNDVRPNLKEHQSIVAEICEQQL